MRGGVSKPESGQRGMSKPYGGTQSVPNRKDPSSEELDDAHPHCQLSHSFPALF